MSEPLPNIRYPSPGNLVRFVGGDGMNTDLNAVIQGQVVDEAMFIDGEYQLKVRVPGIAEVILVRMRNLRP